MNRSVTHIVSTNRLYLDI